MAFTIISKFHFALHILCHFSLLSLGNHEYAINYLLYCGYGLMCTMQLWVIHPLTCLFYVITLASSTNVAKTGIESKTIFWISQNSFLIYNFFGGKGCLIPPPLATCLMSTYIIPFLFAVKSLSQLCISSVIVVLLSVHFLVHHIEA